MCVYKQLVNEFMCRVKVGFEKLCMTKVKMINQRENDNIDIKERI